MENFKLDTSKFDEFIESSSKWIDEYARIQKQYDIINKYLKENWKGRGADAFQDDAKNVKSNILGIGDILKTMCDTLYDCNDVFIETDLTLGNSNRNIGQENK